MVSNEINIQYDLELLEKIQDKSDIEFEAIVNKVFLPMILTKLSTKQFYTTSKLYNKKLEYVTNIASIDLDKD